MDQEINTTKATKAPPSLLLKIQYSQIAMLVVAPSANYILKERKGKPKEVNFLEM